MTISQRLKQVRSRIHHAEQTAGRPAGSVCLMAVSKTQSPAAVAAAYRAGQRHFGENYLQEAIAKQRCLSNYRVTWHFIGPVQSNKTQIIASRFSWVHSVDRMKIARRLNQQRPFDLGPLNICLQINIDGEESKSGISIEQLPELADEISSLPNLRLRGLMTIPAIRKDTTSASTPFRKMRNAFHNLVTKGYCLDTLSMGMSDDLEAAITEDSTIVRIGTSIFGPRRISQPAPADPNTV